MFKSTNLYIWKCINLVEYVSKHKELVATIFKIQIQGVHQVKHHWVIWKNKMILKDQSQTDQIEDIL